LGKRPRQDGEDEGCHPQDTEAWEDQENTQQQVALAGNLPVSISVIQHMHQAGKAKVASLTTLLNPIYTLVQSSQHLVQQLVPIGSAPPAEPEQEGPTAATTQASQQQLENGIALTSSSLMTASSGGEPSAAAAAAGAMVTEACAAAAEAAGTATGSISVQPEPEVTCVSPSNPAAMAAAVPAGSDQTEATGGYSIPQTSQEDAYANMDADEDEDDDELLDPLLFIGRLPPLETCVSAKRMHLLPRKTRNCKQKTLVLDLDETLVHSTLDAAQGVGADFHFPVHFNGAEHLVYVRQRPHVSLFLERVAQHFEVVVFTASQKVYAERLLNILDPKRNLIRHRIYRDSCVLVDGNYLKDLSVLGRDLAATAIVDNSPQAFGFQLDNGIPIESWYEDKDDEELLRLLPFLEQLRDVEDVRPYIQARYRMREKVQASTAAALAAAVAQTGAVVGLPMAPPVRFMQAVPQAQAQQA